MVFKLLRLDVTDSSKIVLEVGNHLIGRGKFLHCDDKRVSRQHGELRVSDDSVTLKALHTNPCFYIKKDTLNREMLKQSDSIDLGNGDRFGLLPADCWYVILCLNNIETEELKDLGAISKNNESAILDQTEINTDTDVTDRTRGSSPLAQLSSNPYINESTQNPRDDNELSEPSKPNDSQSQSLLNDSNDSQSILQNVCPELSTENIRDSSQSPLQMNPQDLPNDPCEQSTEESIPVQVKTEQEERDQPSPMKRPLPSISDVKQEPEEGEAKRVKTEAEDTAAGCSNQQNAMKIRTKVESESQSTESSKTYLTNVVLNEITNHLQHTVHLDRWDHSAKNPEPPPGAAPAPPAGPTPRPRERCMYGNECYRRNPAHKQQYSHPPDADWGAGPLGVCPYGRACARRNPAHWARNTHPPGTLPPGDRQQGNKQRRRKVKKQSTDSEDSDQSTPDVPDDVILTGKRARKKVNVQQWSDSESNEDPFGTDDEDEWQPSGNLDTDIGSQFNSQDE